VSVRARLALPVRDGAALFIGEGAALLHLAHAALALGVPAREGDLHLLALRDGLFVAFLLDDELAGGRSDVVAAAALFTLLVLLALLAGEGGAGQQRQQAQHHLHQE